MGKFILAAGTSLRMYTNMKHLIPRISKAAALGLAFSIMLGTQALAASKFEQFVNEAEEFYKNKAYTEAQRCFEQAIKESDKLEKGDKRVPTAFYNLALVFQAEGKYADSEKFMLKAIDLMSATYGPEHQRVASAYMDLGDLYVEESGAENKPDLKAKASEAYKKGTDLFEKIYAQATSSGDNEDKPEKTNSTGKTPAQSSAADLSNALRLVADFYSEGEQFDKAEPLYLRSLELEEYAVGKDDKELGSHKEKVAEYLCVNGKYKQADPLFKDALENAEKNYGADSQEAAVIAYNYGGKFYDEGTFGDAEVFFKKAMAIFEKNPSADEQDLAMKNISLADVLDMQGKHEEATATYKKALAVLEKNPDKQVLVRGLKQYQKHLLMQNKKDEAAKVANRIKDLKAETKTDAKNEPKAQ